MTSIRTVLCLILSCPIMEFWLDDGLVSVLANPLYDHEGQD